MAEPTDRDPARVRAILDAHLASLPPGQILFPGFHMAWAKQFRVSRKHTCLWVADALNDGRIAERRDNLYEKARPTKPSKPHPKAAPLSDAQVDAIYAAIRQALRDCLDIYEANDRRDPATFLGR